MLEQSLDIAVELGDQPNRLKKLMKLGSIFYNKGQDRSAQDCFDKALALAQKLNDAHSQAQCLTSLGLGRLWGDLGQGKTLFEQALPLFEAAGDWNGATYCRAMLDVAAELGPKNLRVGFSSDKGFNQPIIGFYAGCDVFQAVAGKVSHPSETCYIGYTWPNELAQSPLQISRVFWQVSHLRTILDTSVPIGGSWSGNAFSNTSEPLKATVTVLSDTQTVTVPAGTFTGCLLTEQVTTEDGSPTEVNAEFRGTVRAWYGRGVGLVQSQIQHDDGLKATLQLQTYEVLEDRQRLPASGDRQSLGIWLVGCPDRIPGQRSLPRDRTGRQSVVYRALCVCVSAARLTNLCEQASPGLESKRHPALKGRAIESTKPLRG